MTIKDFLENLDISQQEFSDFIGIPRGRIAYWITDNREIPPKNHDAKIYQLAVSYLSKFTKEKAQAMVRTHRIIAGNVEPKEAYDKMVNTGGIVNEPLETYGLLPDNQKDTVNSAPPLPKTGEQTMSVDRLYALLERSIANEERTSQALLNISQTNENLSGILAYHFGMLKTEQRKKATGT